LYKHSPGIIFSDNPEENIYPMPVTATGNDAVHIGRIRRDGSCENGVSLFVACDNTRKGAAANAVQIVEWLHAGGFF
jgi:aspartate-semialdehyde dehydrogenase